MKILSEFNWKKWLPFLVLLLFTVSAEAQKRKKKRKQKEEVVVMQVVDTIPAYTRAITRQVMHEKWTKSNWPCFP